MESWTSMSTANREAGSMFSEFDRWYVPEYKTIEYDKLLDAQQAQINYIYAHLTNLTRTGVASANEARQFCEDWTGTKKSAKIYKKKGHNCIPIPVEDSSGIRIRWVSLPNKKPPEKSNKKKGIATSTIAMLIFLLMWLNGVCFWSFIFNMIIH